MEIHFDHPTALLSLWLLLPLGLVLWFAERRKRRAGELLLSPAMGRRLLPERRPLRAWLRGALLLLAFASAAVAWSRPRFGVYFEPTVQRGADVMVLLDVSRSMLSEDVAPNRLDRSKSDILDLLRRLASDRVGLVAFAGRPAMICPLTTDHSYFQRMLHSVGPGSALVGGTAVGDAIRFGLRAMEERRDRDQALLLITDGEDQESFPQDAAALAAAREVKIFTVGLGDPEHGARIPITTDSGDKAFLKHEGQEIWSKMNEGLLEEIALATGGAYVPARTTAYDLGKVYEDHLRSLAAGEIRTDERKRFLDRFQVFLAAGVVLFVLEMLLSPYPRRRAGSVAVRASAAVLLCLLGWPSAARAGEAGERVREGIALWHAGQYEQALAAFDAALEEQPDEPILQFDRGAAQHGAGATAEARSAYLAAAGTPRSSLAADAHYNLGLLSAEEACTLFGEEPVEADPETRENGLQLLGSAIQQFRTCLERKPDHADARHNLELLRVWMKHMADQWAQRDREERQQEMDLLQFLTYLMKEQQALRAAVTPFLDQPDSPRLRVLVNEIERRQEELAGEVPVLEDKIEEGFAQQQQAAAPGGAPPPPDEQMAQIRSWMLQQVGTAAGSMRGAAQRRREHQLADARQQQTAAFDALDRLFTMIVPFDQALQEAVAIERPLVSSSASRVSADAAAEPEPQGAAEPAVPADPAVSGGTAAPQQAEPLHERVDWYTESARQQDRVASISELLPMKGREFAARMEAMQQAQTPVDPPSGADPDAPVPEAEREGEMTPEEQLAAVQRAVEKAGELAPQIVELCRLASADLLDEDVSSALLRQRRALELLEEILAELPKQPQDESQQQDEPGDQGDQQDEDPQQPEDEPQPEDGQQQDGAQEQPPPQQITKEQLEAMLRKVLEREQESEERRKELEALIAGKAEVDRDW